MKAKFLLHGGSTDLPTPGNAEFFQKLVAGPAFNGKVLLVYLARQPEKWKELQEKDVQKFSHYLAGKDVKYIIANEDRDELLKQIREVNTIFIRGGKTDVLLQYFKSFSLEELTSALDGKVVGASSAGAYIFSTYYFANSLGTVEKGLGILPVKIYCHFDESSADNIKKLELMEQNLPLLKIPEGSYIEYDYNNE